MSANTFPAEAPAASEQQDLQASVPEQTEETVTADALIEEVSIDGMCGVY